MKTPAPLHLLAAVAIGAALADAAPSSAQPASGHDAAQIHGALVEHVLNGKVMISLSGGEFIDYRPAHQFHQTPGIVYAAWDELREPAASARWEIYRPDPSRSNGRHTVASGPIGGGPFQAGRTVYFHIKLDDALPPENTGNQPAEYRVGVFSTPVVRQATGPQPQLQTGGEQPAMRRSSGRISTAPRQPRTAPAEPQPSARQLGSAARTVHQIQAAEEMQSGYTRITHLSSHTEPPSTTFTQVGLRPELLHTMPIAIDLQTLRVQGDDAVEPYLLVAVVYADGTTIQPQLSLAQQQVTFSTSSVRISGAPNTHGNVAGSSSMSSGQTVTIPAATGHYEATVRPIGLQLAEQYNLTSEQRRQLRANTQIGIVVVGMEEDNIPSTATANEMRVLFLSELQSALDGIVQGVVIHASNPTQTPDLVQAAAELQTEIVGRLRSAAEAKTIAELAAYLAIPAAPLLGLVPGVLNADDYVGTDVFVVSYQELLDAAEAGQPFTLHLADNPDEAVRYVITGRIRIR